jgi:beta-galactosidase/beta-glucuronidase
MDLPMGENMLTWDEFDPALYKLQAELISKHGKESKTVQFGMREFKIGVNGFM